MGTCKTCFTVISDKDVYCSECLHRIIQSDPINPTHYTDGYNNRETIENMVLTFGPQKVIAFCECNAYKYRARAGRKDPEKITEDIQKAMWYEDRARDLQSRNRKNP